MLKCIDWVIYVARKIAAEKRYATIETAATLNKRINCKLESDGLEVSKLAAVAGKYEKLVSKSQYRESTRVARVQRQRKDEHDKFSKLRANQSKEVLRSEEKVKSTITRMQSKEAAANKLKYALFKRRCNTIKVRKSRELEVRRNLLELRVQEQEARRLLLERIKAKEALVDAQKLQIANALAIHDIVEAKMSRYNIERNDNPYLFLDERRMRTESKKQRPTILDNNLAQS